MGEQIQRRTDKAQFIFSCFFVNKASGIKYKNAVFHMSDGNNYSPVDVEEDERVADSLLGIGRQEGAVCLFQSVKESIGDFFQLLILIDQNHSQSKSHLVTLGLRFYIFLSVPNDNFRDENWYGSRSTPVDALLSQLKL